MAGNRCHWHPPTDPRILAFAGTCLRKNILQQVPDRYFNRGIELVHYIYVLTNANSTYTNL